MTILQYIKETQIYKIYLYICTDIGLDIDLPWYRNVKMCNDYYSLVKFIYKYKHQVVYYLVIFFCFQTRFYAESDLGLDTQERITLDF